MIEVDFITLEDGLEYDIVDEIIINGIKYIYLVHDETNKVELRKLDEKQNLILLDNEKEVEKALIEFAKIHRNDLAN